MNRDAALVQLNRLLHNMREAEEKNLSRIQDVHPHYREGARNLLYYLALRSQDILELQRYLSDRGLSALRFAESDTYGNVKAVLQWLEGNETEEQVVQYDAASQRLQQNATRHFKVDAPFPLVMVTLSAQRFADEGGYIASLMEAGMQIARINCGHDAPEIWMKMAHQVREVAALKQRSCAVYFDLSGPKLRIASIQNRKGKEKERAKLSCGHYVVMANHLAEERQWGPARWWMQPAIPDLVNFLAVGQEVHFDDGIARGKVVEKAEGRALIELHFTEVEWVRIKVDAGINIPALASEFPALTQEDRLHVEMLSGVANIFGLSFVNRIQDITELRRMLRQHAPNTGLMIKLETPEAFRHFPDILFELMRHQNVGVMIARGDLGLSMGFDRLSEVQEEVLWLCEAAGIPVVWATQVLEKMVKKGLPSRPEITDAAMAVRAEAVMLNKGPHQQEALTFLNTILTRMHGHYHKKRSLMRPLSLAKRFLDERGLMPVIPKDTQ